MVLPWRRGGRVGRRRVLSRRSRPRAASLACTVFAGVLLGACSGIDDPAPSAPRSVREVLGDRTPTPTYSPLPTPTPTPTQIEEPTGRYVLDDAFPRIKGYKYRVVPPRLRRAALRRWRGIDSPPLQGPRIRYLVRARAIRASTVAFAARSDTRGFDEFVRSVLRGKPRSGRRRSIDLGRSVEAITRSGGDELREVVFTKDNLLVSVLALRRPEGEKIARSIAVSL